MASIAAGLPGQIPILSEGLCQKKTVKLLALGLSSPATETTCRFDQGRLLSKARQLRRPMALGSYFGNYDDHSSSLSPSETVKEFYKSINDGNVRQLAHYISADCHIDERSFPVPFQGRKEILKFFKHLMEGMGENVKFKVNRVCEGDELIAAANWHLEWKNEEIPFTRGCSFFEFRKEGGKIMIKKAQIVIESPVKPGAIVLQLLKIVTKIFNNFPTATRWFLRSHQMILNLFLRIYSVIVAIFIDPFLNNFLQVWNIMNRIQGHGFSVILNILKLFIK